MFNLVLQRLDNAARMALPFVTALLCVLLGVVAWPLPWLGAVAPPLALVTLYYWSIHRPDLFRPWMAFVIGLLNDTVHFLPLGTSALLFVAAHQVIFRQRRFFAGHSFFMLWSGFALTALVVMSLGWLLQGLISWHLAPIFPLLMQSLLAIVFFPLPCWLLIRLQRAALTQA
ncbi:MAG: rod shape-determining protein MreD [Pseudomonadota bacterium]|nr:rod shape-determining protein MreD [Pseudomonadota bacterium]